MRGGAAGTRVNIGRRLRAAAEATPEKAAVVATNPRAHGTHEGRPRLTFRELDRESDACARGLAAAGLGRGMRTLLFVRPGLRFFELAFALFKLGAVPVLIDPGMGRERLLHCIRHVEPEALVGVPKAHLARWLRPAAFRSVRIAVRVGGWAPGGAHSLRALRRHAPEPFAVAETGGDELAAILFTTGSTGPAKGVEYTHGIFEAQCGLIGATYDVTSADVDLPTFPLFGLFSVGLGMTAVVPDMDPTRPARANPARIAGAIDRYGCTFSFGSPALWGRVGAWCAARGRRLPTLRKILMAGAPIPPALHRLLLESVLAPGAETHTPYGATESLPATDMRGSEVLAETAALTGAGGGVCVGRPVPGVEVAIIRMTDTEIPEWSDDLRVPDGEVGEICVKGPTVTRRYFRLPEATRLAKIADGEAVRHRIGDLGYRDPEGRIWYCGRKSHRVETETGLLTTVPREAVFNTHPGVRRAALVGVGEPPHQRPVIVIEPRRMPRTRRAREALRTSILAHGAANPVTAPVRTLLFHPAFPVDIRHNAKIFREKLAPWAARTLGEGGGA